MFKILAFFEECKTGILSGDLSIELINLLNKTLESGERNKGVILKKVHESFGDIGFNLPVKGIRNPKIENQRNLFERQLILEKISFTSRYFNIVFIF